ncbi:GMC oxidoreductase-domain-containing protein [Chlamydoabsidia padenii]|nr:GMC oxidoreductase-domain-containing protein [Chlamydoabsidia padenii]
MAGLSQGKHHVGFAQLSRQDRESLLLAWQQSSSADLRAIYRGLSGISMMSSYFVAQGEPLHKVLGFPTSDPIRSKPDYVPPQGHYPERLKMLTYKEATAKNLHYDAIVIGSGAGGGVVAAQLAQAGKRVLVIEKGRYYHESEFISCESKGFEHLYEKSSLFPSSDGSLSIMAGSTFGGSTTVNWSASLKPQHFVREDWAKEGLPYYTSSKFADDLDRVCERIGAETSGIRHNIPNQILINGCKKLGYHVDDIPQNTGGKLHPCHWCFTGCKDGIKNGTMNTWLRDAAKNGAQFLDRSRVLRVLVKDGKAVGVECLIHGTPEKIQISADRVVVSAGSLHSPGVLKRSGLSNPNIGRNLRVHPVAFCCGKMDYPVDAWNGSIMTAVSNVTENCHGDYYGAKLEVPVLHPGLFSGMMPWRGAREHKQLMLEFRNFAPVVVLVRDKDSVASVSYDEEGEVIVDFKVSKHDADSVTAGLVAAFRVLVADGARELHTSDPRTPVFVFNSDEPSDVNNPRFNAWLDDLRARGPPETLASAHLMGSCRMGISPQNSVINPQGEAHEVKNLYVADASVFPTSTGKIYIYM